MHLIVPSLMNSTMSSIVYAVCSHDWPFLEADKRRSRTLNADHHFFPFHLEIGGTNSHLPLGGALSHISCVPSLSVLASLKISTPSAPRPHIALVHPRGSRPSSLPRSPGALSPRPLPHLPMNPPECTHAVALKKTPASLPLHGTI